MHPVNFGLYCFFFKQKTAYEMRISDWSSDVCSSDLVEGKALKATAEGSIDTTVAPRQFAATVVVQEADLDAYLPPEGAAKPQQPPGEPAAGTGWSEEPSDLAVLRDNAGQVDVTLNAVRYRGLVGEPEVRRDAGGERWGEDR